MKTISSLSQAREIVANTNLDMILEKEEWSGYKTLVHCAKTIQYSMTGYPVLKPYFIRITIGKIVIHKFLKQGYMKHSLSADVMGSPPVEDNGTTESGKIILLEAIDKFLAYQETLHPHLLFGKINKKQYDNYFALHIGDHLHM